MELVLMGCIIASYLAELIKIEPHNLEMTEERIIWEHYFATEHFYSIHIMQSKTEKDGLRMFVPGEKGIAHCTTERISGPAHQYQTSMPRKETLKQSRCRPGLSG